MSNKGYVATAGGFCVAISTTSETEETNAKQNAVKTTNAATESASPSTQTAANPLIKESA